MNTHETNWLKAKDTYRAGYTTAVQPWIDMIKQTDKTTSEAVEAIRSTQFYQQSPESRQILLDAAAYEIERRVR